MKKAALKLIPALCMLLISAMMLGTTTYAWFSMNNQVTATGINITARNASGNLIIGAQTYTNGVADVGFNLASVQTAHLTSVNLGDSIYNYTTDFAVQPSAHLAYSGSNPITFFNTLANWERNTADNPSSSVASSSAVPIGSSFDGYVLYYDLYITVEPGSPDMIDLKCSSVTITPSGSGTDQVRNGYRVIVASGSAYDEFYNSHVENGSSATVPEKKTSSVVLASTVTSSDWVPVRVYIYLDGEDASTYTNNFGNLKSAIISLTFNANDNPTVSSTVAP